MYNQYVLWYHKDNNRHGYLYTTSMFSDIKDNNRHGYLYTTRMFSDITKTIIDMGIYYNQYVLWCHKDNNRHGYLYTTSMFSDITKTIIDMGIYIQPVCSLISQRQLSTWVSIYNQNVLWYHKDNNRHGYLYTTGMFSDITKTIIDMGIYIQPVCSLISQRQ